MKFSRNSLASMLLPTLGVAAVCLNAANAQNANYAPGDLVLFFQQEGGSKTVYANLGNAALTFRGTSAGAGVPNKVNFLNISSALTTAFGAGWATDPTVYAGLAGIWRTSDTSVTVQDGDPSRTVYISKSRDSVGVVGAASSSTWILGDSSITFASQGILNQNNVLETQYTTAVAVSPTSTSTIDEQNPFFAAGIQGPAMQGSLEGGIQQGGSSSNFGSFGAAGTVKFALDLYRVLARNDLTQVGGTVGQGSYEGTVTINSSGLVSFISESGTTATPFQTWALTFPALNTAAKRLPTADPDNDGMSNLMEFVLNGNPSVADPSSAPALNASGSNVVFSFTRRDDSEAGSTLLFQYGSDLSGWTNATIGAGSAVVGNATISVTQNASSDAITVTVPKSAFPGGKFFGRLKVSQ